VGLGSAGGDRSTRSDALDADATGLVALLGRKLVDGALGTAMFVA
jgi:hypothetical protein